jgi:hypothetical protein
MQMQDIRPNSKDRGSARHGELSFPVLKLLAGPFGFRYVDVSSDPEKILRLGALSDDDAVELLRISIAPTARVVPQVRFLSQNENVNPFTLQLGFLQFTLIDPLRVSR